MDEYHFNTRYNYRQFSDSLKWSLQTNNEIPLWLADSDYLVDDQIISSIIERANHGIFGYNSDSIELKEAISDHLYFSYKWIVEVDSIVLIPSITSGLNIVRYIVHSMNKNSIITGTPVYPRLYNSATIVPIKNITFPLSLSQNKWYIDTSTINKYLTNQVGAFFLCNPHNPIGRSYTKHELEILANFCLESNLIICSDESHSDIVYKNSIHTPIASISDEISKNTITFMSPAKAFNIAGLNCAFAIIENKKTKKLFIDSCDGLLGNVNIFGINAAIAAYKHGAKWRKNLISYLEINRNLVYEQIKLMDGLDVSPIDSTYLAWINVSNLNNNSIPSRFFKENGVLLSDGSIFGNSDYIRLNFACSFNTLKAALNRMKGAIKMTQK